MSDALNKLNSNIGAIGSGLSQLSSDLHSIKRSQGIIEAGVATITYNVATVDNKVDNVNRNVQIVDNDIKIADSHVQQLAQDFNDFVIVQMKQNRLLRAETKLVQIRQEIEKKFGHYDVVRRTTTGILQAADLKIVRKELIRTVTEELMLKTPGYWLTPCLMALAAWINDQPDIAERAVPEAIRRNDENTSLFWTLVCRRAGRKQICTKWAARYLANQDEEALDRSAIVIIDAYASGLLGADPEGVVSQQLAEWLDRLSEKPGFTEKQIKQWAAAISLLKKPVTSGYTYLVKYSPTWPVLNDILNGAYLHSRFLEYLINIFEQETSKATVKQQLDETLNRLVTDFDKEELPLRKSEKFEQLVVEFGGDEQLARQQMSVEEVAFKKNQDFTQLLTNAAMSPQIIHASAAAQKFAVAMSKEWILTAYNDLTAENRMKIPAAIEIKVDSFSAKTADGKDEREQLAAYNAHIDSEKKAAMAKNAMTLFEKYSKLIGLILAAIGLVMSLYNYIYNMYYHVQTGPNGGYLDGDVFMGLAVAIIGGAFVLKHYSAKKRIDSLNRRIEEQYENKRKDGLIIMRAIIAEVVDFWDEFTQKDSESQKVADFLNQITPDQYVKKLDNSSRRIKV